MLTLTDSYVPGSDITTATFVSFNYTSSRINFTIENQPGMFLAGGLNEDDSVNAAGEIIIQSAAACTPGDVAASLRRWCFSSDVMSGASPGFPGLRVTTTLLHVIRDHSGVPEGSGGGSQRG